MRTTSYHSRPVSLSSAGSSNSTTATRMAAPAATTTGPMMTAAPLTKAPASLDGHEVDPNLAAFAREVRNLLRSKPNCMIPFSKFVPAYHNHYGRQCCVYQFGFTKLIELLEAIPHVVQILGEPAGGEAASASASVSSKAGTTQRYITLTHREQIKRFASDLIKVVKAAPGKRLRLSQFARAYEQVLGQVFRVQDYGTNDINVLLVEIWEGTINIIPINRESLEREEQLEGGRVESESESDSEFESEIEVETETETEAETEAGAEARAESKLRGHRRRNNYGRGQSSRSGPLFVGVPLGWNPVLEQLVARNKLTQKPYITDQYPDCWFEIPRRERSDKEIKRTRYFVADCIELLSRLPPESRYTLPFSKFIPAYHYYFNRQCKVSIFGFSKLIDLFESIAPDVVEILEQGPGEEKLIRLARRHWPAPKSARPAAVRSSSGAPPSPRAAQKASGVDGDGDGDCGNCGVAGSPSQLLEPIDSGPTEEELLILEEELCAYEELQVVRKKRSGRMAAMFDIFKYSLY